MTGKCPVCGAKEVEANTPYTVYACGSSDYDGNPDTFEQKCSEYTQKLRKFAIERYTPEVDEYRAEMTLSDDGGWVHIDDYTRLTVLCEKMGEALEAIRDMPNYDQDDHLRMRNIARAALKEEV